MEYLGEKLWIGNFGHLLIVIGFIAALFSNLYILLSLFTKEINEKKKWHNWARMFFILQSVVVFIIFGLVFYMCKSHLFEYVYAYKHSSKELEARYLLACIWEGQEGSFLLWLMWHSVLGSFLIFKNRNYTNTVLVIINIAQAFMWLMLMGIYFGDLKLGASLFALTRNEIEAPIFSRPEYLSMIKDGVGLNVLLRNYWMVIHPPILFFGFATTIIPFGISIWGLRNKEYKDWAKPALPWSLLSTCVLGVGIMMGGKWAYESLSFGGYWAWDPVENASLVPWLIMVSLLHALLILKAVGHSVKASFVFAWLAFFFIIYSTFLTKSGILGDASVHSFTDPGKTTNALLLIFMSFCFFVPLIYLLLNINKFPKETREETMDSREFWMFIGSLIFFITAIFIITKTSFVPIYNKLLDITETKKAEQEDIELSYNKVIAIVTIFLGTITAFTQFLKYKNSAKSVWVNILIPTVLALIFTIIFGFLNPIQYNTHGIGFLSILYIAFWAGMYAILGNLFYIIKYTKLKLKFIGSSLTHIGFGLLIVGILISSANKKTLSDNRVTNIELPKGIDPQTKKEDKPGENLTLIKDLPTKMSNYSVTYIGDSTNNLEKNRKFYKLIFNNNTKKETFNLAPDVYMMKDNSFSSNPDIINYWNKDVFTYLTHVLNKNENKGDSSKFKSYELKTGDSVFYSKGIISLDKVEKSANDNKFKATLGDLSLTATLTVKPLFGIPHKVQPMLNVFENQLQLIDDTAFAQNIIVKFSGVADTSRRIKIGVKETSLPMDYVAIKSYEFPMISLVWLGVILMAWGLIISLINRANLSNKVSYIVGFLIIAALFYMFFIASV